MKLKFVYLLVAILTTVSLNTSVVRAQPTQERTGRMEQLGLTAEQQSQLAQIRKNTRQQIDEILTAEQKSQYQNAIAAGKNRREAMTSLNLSSEQKQKMKELMRSQRQQVSNLLTPEQKQKLRERRELRS